MKKILKPSIFLSDEVYHALKHDEPIVALESTIISHGMPYPKNVECALELEKIVRDNGAVPATIAIIDGDIKIGLSKEDIEKIGNGKTEVVKVSKRDLPIVTARGQCGATTVSATMYLASKVGINVFATGGIGGVHRNQLEVRDISNDLEEMSLNDCIVVCAGVKSILDIPNTLEYLETKGVPVLGYKTKEMPAFYTKHSGVELEYEAKDAKEVAHIAHDKWALDLDGGILVVNPIPDEYSYPQDEINNVIKEALSKAKEENVTGKRITPFLLKDIVELTKGKSLDANIALVKNNCYVASLIAKELKENEKD